MSAPRILVVDDEPEVVVLLAARLRDAGYLPTTASNGGEALDIIRQGHPDLILCDLYMPEMNGLTLFNAVRTDPRTSSIPFVIFTGKEVAGDRFYANGVGVDCFLNKPIEPAILQICLQQFVGRGQREDESPTDEMPPEEKLGLRMTTVQVNAARPDLSQPEAFVLSRLAAGEIPLRDLLELCPMPEGEVRSILERLIAVGVVGRGPKN